ncbi:predicted protein [Naegleria gruberi]|uniref:Predicted protein n=1 Tax=Naegleria gruberi TaxID=5762 RepID=D2W669_NAEGR|nr:uncharacterized protein NAEGRDRAFT_54917 [Naegleria gruberi]EFC35433.1 predicted protein [Naegleria gruberi]|eukprot:XP_002668177.1 predicted protein [Naegleria gruberi strain NEG-M]
MFKFPKYAISVSDYEVEPNNSEGLISLKVGDLMILLREYETGLGWALVQKVDIRDVHRNGCRVYDHDIPRNEKHIGFVPTAFLAALRFEPQKFDPSVPLDLQVALSENGEEYQKKIGVRFYIYEGYYRDRHEDVCMISKAKLKTNVPKMHCLESDKFEDFNISMEEWEKKSVEEWKIKARETIAQRKPIPIHDVFLVKNSKHPAHLHWLTKGSYVAETLNNALLAYADRPCLGYRRKIAKDQYENKYRWFTYAQLHERVLRFGNGLRICFNNEKLLTQHRENQKEINRGFVGICSINRPDGLC